MVLEKNVKTFWTRVSRIGETTSPQEEAWVDCKSYGNKTKGKNIYQVLESVVETANLKKEYFSRE